MTLPMPRVFYESPPATPLGYGLYAAATVTDVPGPARIQGGVQYRSPNCGSAGTWPTDPCAVLINEAWSVSITGTPTGGTFTLTVDSYTTAPIPFNATAAQVKAALEALSNITTVNAAGGALPGAPVTITFVSPANIGLMTANGAGLTGGTTPAVVTARTVAGQAKVGTRPGDTFFDPITMWAYDECGLDEDIATIRANAQQTLRLRGETFVESFFAARLLADDGTPVAVTGIVAAVSALEEAIGESGLTGVLHAPMRFAAQAADHQLIIRSGSKLLTPLGHQWAFGGGYASVMGNTITMTGPTSVWRTPVSVYDTLGLPSHNIHASVAEQTVVAAYECFISSATVS